MYLVWFLSVIAIDQAFKWLFAANTVLNTGISLNVLTAVSWWVLLVVWLLGWWVTTRYLPVPRWSHAVFWGAAASNILDRVFWGGVRDIWSVPGLPLMNNAADWVLASIAVYWMWYLYRQEHYA